jgi:hypothetical protein
MKRSHIYIRITIEDEEGTEEPQRVAKEIARSVRRIYGVKEVEVSSIQTES